MAEAAAMEEALPYMHDAAVLPMDS